MSRILFYAVASTVLLASPAGAAEAVTEGHADRRGDPRPRVPDAEQVVLALAGLGETRDPGARAEHLELIESPGEDLVGVALVPNIEEQPIVRKVKHAVHRDREFDNPEVRGEVPAAA